MRRRTHPHGSPRRGAGKNKKWRKVTLGRGSAPVPIQTRKMYLKNVLPMVDAIVMANRKCVSRPFMENSRAISVRKLFLAPIEGQAFAGNRNAYSFRRKRRSHSEFTI